MYLTNLLSLAVLAVRETFDSEYVEEDFRRLWCSLEYPVDQASYPGIWVDYLPTTNIQAAGIAHVEYTPPGLDGSYRKFTRWRYAGQIQLTVVTLSSLERARLVDEVVKVIAFGRENPSRSRFIRLIESNDLIGCQVQLDRIGVSGKDESAGTPWGTDEFIYEQTVVLDCEGEFVSDGTDAVLVPLSSVQVTPYRDGETVPEGEGWQ